MQETWYKLDLDVDSSIFQVRDIKKAKINLMTMTFDLENQGQTYTYVTFIYIWLYTSYRLDLGRGSQINQKETRDLEVDLEIQDHTSVPVWALLSLAVNMIQTLSWCWF